MGLPRIWTRGFPWNRVEANRAGMMPTTRLRNFLNRVQYARAPTAAATATPATMPWRIQNFAPLEDSNDEEDEDDEEDEGEEQIAMTKKKEEEEDDERRSRWKRVVSAFSWSGEQNEGYYDVRSLWLLPTLVTVPNWNNITRICLRCV